VAVCRSSGGEQDQPSGFVQALIALFVSWPAALYFFLRGIHKTSVVQIKMPQCHQCAQRGAPQPRYVDFANGRMTFVVHKNLKEAIDREEGVVLATVAERSHSPTRQRELLQALQTRPFCPFRIHAADGAVYDVYRPDLVWLTTTYALVGFPAPENAPPTIERHDVIDLFHIASLEPIETLPSRATPSQAAQLKT